MQEKAVDLRPHPTTRQDCLNALGDALQRLREAKPQKRSEESRRFAVTITEMEKVFSYFRVYIIDDRTF